VVEGNVDQVDWEDRPENAAHKARAELMRKGMINALASLPGADAHALHQRFAECVPFFDGAIKDAGDSVSADALLHLKEFFMGSDT